MNADPELQTWLATDPNTLPYFVIEAATGDSVPVWFEPLTENDLPELQSERWADAIFRDVWLDYAGTARTLKLVREMTPANHIEGLIHVGQIEYGGNALQESLLEAAPVNRNSFQAQRFRGIGRVLVARLVVESLREGANGRVAVRARPGAEGFYRALSFRGSPYKPLAFTLFPPEAEQLLRSVLYDTT